MFVAAGPRGHHVPALRREGGPVEHRHHRVPVPDREGALPGGCPAPRAQRGDEDGHAHAGSSPQALPRAASFSGVGAWVTPQFQGANNQLHQTPGVPQGQLALQTVRPWLPSCSPRSSACRGRAGQDRPRGARGLMPRAEHLGWSSCPAPPGPSHPRPPPGQQPPGPPPLLREEQDPGAHVSPSPPLPSPAPKGPRQADLCALAPPASPGRPRPP